MRDPLEIRYRYLLLVVCLEFQTINQPINQVISPFSISGQFHAFSSIFFG